METLIKKLDYEVEDFDTDNFVKDFSRVVEKTHNALVEYLDKQDRILEEAKQELKESEDYEHLSGHDAWRRDAEKKLEVAEYALVQLDKVADAMLAFILFSDKTLRIGQP